MTFETKQKKRKAAASAPSSIAKKVKPAPVRKKAADFMSDSSDSEGGWEALEGVKEKGGKKRKEGSGEKKGKNDKKDRKDRKDKKEKDKKEKVEKVGEVEKVGKEERKKEEAKKEKKKTKKSNKKDIIPLDAPAPAEDSAADSEEEEIDDQTATLLMGFESSDDEDEEEVHQVDKANMAIARIPDEKKVKKKVAGLNGYKPTPGVLYLGRIPHGFYEQEMRSYFSQFGTVTRLRLSRNKKTGHSKHYAFLEFADQEVAQIVAETMDNYLLFGHILKCKIVPRDDLELIERLFKGANKRFKPRPGAKLQRALQERKRTVEDWGKKQVRERVRRRRAVEGLKAKGIEYEFKIPELETPAGVKMGAVEAPGVVEKVVEETVEAVAQNDGVEEVQVVVKKGKKSKEPKSKAKVKKPAKKSKA